MDNLMITPLLLGLLVTTSPCVLPLYPGFLAYLRGQTEPIVQVLITPGHFDLVGLG